MIFRMVPINAINIKLDSHCVLLPWLGIQRFSKWIIRHDNPRIVAAKSVDEMAEIFHSELLERMDLSY